MKYNILAISDTEPVSLEEMRSQLGITAADDTARDDSIERAISSARAWAESFTESAVVTQTRAQYYSAFPDYFKLSAPLQSVGSIKYLDTDGIEQILDAADYIIDILNAEVHPGYEVNWPDARLQINSISIEYDSGYESPEETSLLYKQAIIIVVSHWEKYFDLSESNSYIGRIPAVAEDLIRRFKPGGEMV